MSSVDDLRAHLRTNFHTKLLDASMRNLADVGNPLRLNNFSSSFRELVRHVFADLAPDADVKKCEWYEPDASSRTGITRAHKVSYIIHGGIAPAYAQDTLGVDVEDERQMLVKTVDRLSKFTHVNEETFDWPSDDITRIAEDACASLRDLLTCANGARATLSELLEAKIYDQVVAEAISETILSVDEIATHHSVERVDVDEVTVTRVGSNEIEFTAYGSVEVELQWGSNADVARDDGAVGSESFPMTCRLTSPVEMPNALSVVEDSLCVDTSSWWEGYYDEE